MPLDPADLCNNCSRDDDDDTIYRVHPAIGIARVGNSAREFFLGPEEPGRAPRAGATRDELKGDLSTVAWRRDAPKRPYVSTDTESFRDSGRKIKRQGVRFRVYQYKRRRVEGRIVWQCTGEITQALAELKWTVHLANLKGAAKDSSLQHLSASTDRTGVPRLDSGPHSISARDDHVKLAAGSSFGEIKLGDLLMDRDGRLIVLGGHGKSVLSPALKTARDISFFSNRDSYDDVSDGPVEVEIRFKGAAAPVPNKRIKHAWVVVAPPRFAPGLFSVTTLYDRMLETWIKRGDAAPSSDLPVSIVEKGTGVSNLREIMRGKPPDYVNDIKPIFQRTLDLEWVFGPAFGRHPKLDQLFAPGDNHKADDDKLREERAEVKRNVLAVLKRYLDATATHASGEDATDASTAINQAIRADGTQTFVSSFAQFRNYVFQSVCPPIAPYTVSGVRELRTPAARRDVGTERSERLDSFQHTMPALLSGPRATVTEQQYRVLRRWALGDFRDEASETPRQPMADDPFRLDIAALEHACGGPFYPGIEVGLLCTETQIFEEPLRVKRGSPSENGGEVRAGFFSQQMAVPWQADFFLCNSDRSRNGIYWPAQRPVHVFDTSDTERVRREVAAKRAEERQEEIAKGEAKLASVPSDMVLWDESIRDPRVSTNGFRNMTDRWHKLGFIVTTATGSYRRDAL